MLLFLGSLFCVTQLEQNDLTRQLERLLLTLMFLQFCDLVVISSFDWSCIV